MNRRKFIQQATLTTAILPSLIACNQNSKSADYSFNEQAVKELKKKFNGQIILPNEQEYEKLRWSRVINPTRDIHPAIMVRCKNEQDVLRSIEFARKYQLEIAVR